MGIRLQEFIHKFEIGTGSLYTRVVLGVVAMIGLAVLYDVVAFRNLSVPEAMDAAQVGRNLSEGRGFSTWFIRPLSLRVVQDHLQPEEADSETAQAAPLALPHPDLENPPLYPLALALALKLMPFGEPAPGSLSQIQLPDLWVGIFNQALFLGAATVLLLVGARLFDETVGWLGAALFVGSDALWQFSLSGLPTMLLLFLFMLLVWVLIRLEAAVREGDRSNFSLLRLAALAGVLVGLGGLTRYAFAWIILPVMIWIFSWRGGRVGHLAMVALGACLLVLAPWVTRNLVVSGTLFGTAGFAIYQDTANYPDDLLPRTSDPDLRDVRSIHVRQKFVRQVRQIVEDELPRLGGSWVAAFFLVGLLMPFRSPAIRQVRGFLVMALLVFLVVQALGRAPPKEGVNPHSLVVIGAPLVMLFGGSLFMVLLDQTRLQYPPWRYIAVGGFWLIMVAPMVFTLLVPPSSPVVFPPYYPPWIQEKSQRVEPQGVVMSDIPWAVAWYGERPSVWMSLAYRNDPERRWRNDFDAVNRVLPVKALYLSAHFLKDLPGQALYDWRLGDADLDAFVRLRSQLAVNWAGEERNVEAGAEADLRALVGFRELLLDSWGQERAGDEDWASFVVGALVKREVPTGFPLRVAFEGEGLYPELFLTDNEREDKKPIQSE